MYIYIYTRTNINADMLSTWKLTWEFDVHLPDYKASHFSSHHFLMLQHEKTLYRTVTRERAEKHIAANRTRKWPHRETFSASSIC